MSVQSDETQTNPLLFHCRAELRDEQLNLPTLPDMSLKIRKAINDEKATSAKIARVVQTDPVIASRLIHIANSPLYLGRRKIDNCPEALTRIGLKASQHFITSFALKSVFVAATAPVRKRMSELWRHSAYVAAICAVLAHKTRGFDPDRATLAGLVHDIGAVPVLTYADRFPQLAANPVHLDETVQALRGALGAVVMRRWSFPDDFQEITSDAENWMREHPGEADYTDVVVLSQLHSFVGDLRTHKHPRLDETPAHAKLFGENPGFDLSRDVLVQAKDEIQRIQQILTG